MEAFRSRVYTDRPQYADYPAAQKFEAIKSIIARRLKEHPKAICSYSGGSDSDIMIDLGIEMDFTPEELERVTKICEHMVGLDYERPYHRHGKAFYRAYRNFYEDVPEGNRLLDKLPECILTVHRDERGATYHLTPTGLAWLGRRIGVVIHNRCR